MGEKREREKERIKNQVSISPLQRIWNNDGYLLMTIPSSIHSLGERTGERETPHCPGAGDRQTWPCGCFVL